MSINALADISSKINQSNTVFFPPDLQKKITLLNSFPIHWWNFIVLENSNPNLQKLTQLCNQLKKDLLEHSVQVHCQSKITDFYPLIKSIITELPKLMEAPHPSKLQNKLNEAIAQASISPKDILSLLRVDPLGIHEKFIDKLQSKNRFNFKKENGFFHDVSTKRVVIPLFFTTPPDQPKTIEAVHLILNNLKLTHSYSIIGPHSSHYENKNQIMNDLVHVQWVGGLATVLIFLLLIATRRAQCLFLIFPIFIGVFLGTLFMIFLHGSIHGLTLSFGTGIIGLCFDYGFHAVFSSNKETRSVWWSNTIGVITTLIVLIILYSSEIPLIKEIMLYSSVGLLSGFACLALTFYFYGDKLRADPIKLNLLFSFITQIKTRKILSTIILVLFTTSSIYAFINTDLDFSLTSFDYKDKNTLKTQKWFYQKMALQPPLFLPINEPHALATSHAHLEFSQKNSINLETLAQYLPENKKQVFNLNSWQNSGYYPSQKKLQLSNEKIKFFEPFFTAIQAVSPITTQTEPTLFTKHLHSNGTWITLFFPDSISQTNLILSQFKSATSLKELVDYFPKILKKEIYNYSLLAFLLVYIVLVIFFRSFYHAMISFIPFLTAVAFVLCASFILNYSLSFMSLIGLTMVFGFSLDLAIFSVSQRRAPETLRAPQVFSALIFATASSILGFLPLLFCKHPVLSHLGVSLTFGTLGTLCASFFLMKITGPLAENQK